MNWKEISDQIDGVVLDTFQEPVFLPALSRSASGIFHSEEELQSLSRAVANQGVSLVVEGAELEIPVLDHPLFPDGARVVVRNREYSVLRHFFDDELVKLILIPTERAAPAGEWR